MALALGAALGHSAPALAELLPGIEAVMVRRLNERTGERVEDRGEGKFSF